MGRRVHGEAADGVGIPSERRVGQASRRENTGAVEAWTQPDDDGSAEGREKRIQPQVAGAAPGLQQQIQKEKPGEDGGTGTGAVPGGGGESNHFGGSKRLNDRATAEKLFYENMRLVPHTIRKYTALAVNEDALQEGLLGLWKAAIHFDADSGNRFATFAVQCIRNQIWQGERSKLRGNIPDAVSLEERLDADTKATFMDILRDEKAELPFEDADTRDMIEKLFTDDEKGVIRYRLNGVGVWRIGNLMGHSGPWAETRIKRIREKLKKEKY